jgi:hypothetical protein
MSRREQMQQNAVRKPAYSMTSSAVQGGGEANRISMAVMAPRSLQFSSFTLDCRLFVPWPSGEAVEYLCFED